MCEKYVLAMYDIRGKQEFIFRTNKLKEIAGGSAVIRDLYKDYLFPVSGKTENGNTKIFYYKDENGNTIPNRDFTPKEFEKHISEGYIGEVVYDGGGNFLLLFKSMEIFKDITYEFTKAVMREVGTLQVLGTAVEIDNFDNYKEDQRRLRLKHSENEASESTIAPWVTLPISMIDRRTGMAITQRYDGIECSKETFAKLKKYKTLKDKESIKKFDDMVLEKGTDSGLAVVYIDGNSMGAKVENLLKDTSDYSSCIKSLRAFSDEIQKIYVTEGVESVVNVLDENKYRVVVAAGDEINFVVRKDEAFKCAKAYLDILAKHENASSCAGIAVFNSHAPYSDAYRIAEECCESGKQLMKKKKMQNACFIDFHMIQNGIGISLEEIRKHENTLSTSRPWLINTTEKSVDKDVTTYSEVERIVEIFRKLGRSNIKGLASVAKDNVATLKLELRRIKAHIPDSSKELKDKMTNLIAQVDKNPNKYKELIYDIVIAYDSWFKSEV